MISWKRTLRFFSHSLRSNSKYWMRTNHFLEQNKKFGELCEFKTNHISFPNFYLHPCIIIQKRFIFHKTKREFSNSTKRGRSYCVITSLLFLLSLVIIREIKKNRKRKERKHLLKILTDKSFIDGYLFDFDDTLVDSDQKLAKSCVKFGKENYFPNLRLFSLTTLKNAWVAFYIMYHQLYQDYYKLFDFVYDHWESDIRKHTGQSRDQFKESFLDHFEHFYRNEVKFFPHTKELLHTLKSKNRTTKFVIVTNAERKFVKAVPRNEVDLTKFFDNILTLEDFTKGRQKPNPYAYIKACQSINTVPGRCVVFEDSRAGIISAKGAGCFVVGLLNGYNTKKKLRSADLVVSMDQLIQILKEKE